LSWCRSKRISASSEARDRNSPTKAHQSRLQISLIGRQHRPIRLHLSADRVSDRDSSGLGRRAEIGNPQEREALMWTSSAINTTRTTMPRHIIMDPSGHSTIEFDSTNTTDLAEAERRFNKLVAKGFIPAESRGQGKPSRAGSKQKSI